MAWDDHEMHYDDAEPVLIGDGILVPGVGYGKVTGFLPETGQLQVTFSLYQGTPYIGDIQHFPSEMEAKAAFESVDEPNDRGEGEPPNDAWTVVRKTADRIHWPFAANFFWSRTSPIEGYSFKVYRVLDHNFALQWRACQEKRVSGAHLILERDATSTRKAMLAVEQFIQKAQAQEATSSF